MNFSTLTLDQLLELHSQTIHRHGGSPGIRDQGLIESALAQPSATFGGVELYPTIVEKACALAFSLIKNHGFIDGNKRIGTAALDAFLRLNGYELDVGADEGERAILEVASGVMPRQPFTEWVKQHTQALHPANGTLNGITHGP